MFTIHPFKQDYQAQQEIVTEVDLFPEAVEFIIQHEGWHTEEHYPYVGYGHKLTPSDKFDHNISHDFAKELVSKDLKQKCTVFRDFGKDSLLLGLLAYNIGEYKVLKSNLIHKIKSGDKNIYNDYIEFCRYKGKVIPSIKNRRVKEYNQFFNKVKQVKYGFKKE